MKKLKVGVIGVGNMGKHHARVYCELPHVNLISVSDTNMELGTKVANKYKAKFYSDYKKMLIKEDISAVSIAVPTPLHYSVAKHAIESKKHVLIEKPITAKLEHAKKLTKLAEKNNVHLGVGHIERFNPVVVKLKRLLSNNIIGQPVSISTKRVGLFPPEIEGTDVIIDLAIHDIDILNFLLEAQPVTIHALGGNAVAHTVNDFAQISFKYPEGIAAHVDVNWITPVKIREITITGTKGVVRGDYINQTLTVYRSNTKKDFKDFKDFLKKFGKAKAKTIRVAKREPLYEELDSFTKSILHDKPQKVDGATATNALEIALRCKKMINNK